MLRKNIFIIAISFLSIHFGIAQEEAVTIGSETGEIRVFDISGRVIDELTGESVPGVNVYITSQEKGAVTNENGVFKLRLMRGYYDMRVSFVGYETRLIPIVVVSEGRILIKLKEDSEMLSEVIVSGRNPTENFESTDMGRHNMGIETMESLPPFMGEVDVIKSMTLLPGVSTVGEASSGFNVRGGGTDQNLILLGGVPIYNSSHLFGFFTAFNPDAVSNVTLHKGGVPSKFGGRGSSIMDVQYKSGDFYTWRAKVNLGTVSSKGSIEGPILKDKLSILANFRLSHINWLMNRTKNPDISSSSAGFYDGNFILSGNLSEKSSLKYALYLSNDEFGLQSDTTIGWQNIGQSLQWVADFSDKLTMEVTLHDSRYSFQIQDEVGVNDFSLKSGIEDTGLKLNFDYAQSDQSKFNIGVESKYIAINPGDMQPLSESSAIPSKQVDKEQGIESAAYVSHDMDLWESIAVSYGVRFNDFRLLGSSTVNIYEDLAPRSVETVVDTREYSANEEIVNYNGIAPRASLRYKLSKNSSIKLGYNTMFQYIHLISNTSAIAPTDTWKLSDNFLKPQKVNQYSAGYFKNFRNNVFETSLEFFYKESENIVEYKDGADLFLNDNLETELVSGEGRAYGAELYMKRNIGRLTGWLSYTYSRSLRLVQSPFESEEINNGDWFPSNFDKPHNLSLVGNYKLNTYVTLSANFNYSTGRPVTFPIAKFNQERTQIAYFDNRNLNRTPDFHRLDLSLKFYLNTDIDLLSGDWSFTVINLYGRKNPFSVFFRDEFGAPPQAYRMSVLGIPFPSLNYTLEF
jgi:hypothetical protein